MSFLFELVVTFGLISLPIGTYRIAEALIEANRLKKVEMRHLGIPDKEIEKK